MIVVDASAILELLLRTPLAGSIERRIRSPGESMHAPHLIDLEVAQVLRRQSLQGEFSAERGHEAIADLYDLSIRRYPHSELIHRIWELRHNLSACDAAYVCLAELLEAPLVTHDSRLAAATGHDAHIELI